ncbi:MAG TPA: hypothetical protein VGH55_02765 [Chthoniobacterales bacterium]
MLSIFPHLLEHCSLGTGGTIVPKLIAAHHGGLQSRYRSIAPIAGWRRIMSGSKKNCLLVALICGVLSWPLSARSHGVDQGEFSPEMLAHKLHLLNCQFEQMETELSSAAGSKLKKLDEIYTDIKHLEAEFRSGRYYADLLDEQIVIVREKLRLIVADPDQAAASE